MNSRVRSQVKSIERDERNRELVRRFQAGDKYAFEELVHLNINLIKKYAMNKLRYVRYLDLDDLIQEGLIAFFKACERYDEDKGSLSTYAVHYLNGLIRNAINDLDNPVRMSYNLKKRITQYDRILYSARENGGLVPSDEEMQRMLAINEQALEAVKAGYAIRDVISLNQELKEDSSLELGDIIESKAEADSKVLDDITYREMLVFLKELINPIEYFVLYYLVMQQSGLSVSDIKGVFGVQKQQINGIRADALKKLREQYFAFGMSYYNSKMKVFRKKIKIEDYNIAPINPDRVTLYIFLRTCFTGEEKQIFKYSIYGRYVINKHNVSSILGIDFEEYQAILNSIREKTTSLLNLHQAEYAQFKERMLSEYKTRILKIDPDIPIEELPFECRCLIRARVV